MEENRKLISRNGVIADIIITLVFAIYITWVCSHHVPGASMESTRWIFGAFAAIPVTGTFWLAISLGRVTIVDMVRRRREGKDF